MTWITWHHHCFQLLLKFARASRLRGSKHPSVHAVLDSFCNNTSHGPELQAAGRLCMSMLGFTCLTHRAIISLGSLLSNQQLKVRHQRACEFFWSISPDPSQVLACAWANVSHILHSKAIHIWFMSRLHLAMPLLNPLFHSLTTSASPSRARDPHLGRLLASLRVVQDCSLNVVEHRGWSCMLSAEE